jgi:hypothetical protein
MSLPAKPTIGTRVRRQVDTLRHYHEIAEVGEIARRYFAMNAFDGVLTAIGVLVGGYLGGVDSPRAIFTVVLTTAVGMGVSASMGRPSSSARSAAGPCASSRSPRSPVSGDPPSHRPPGTPP